jgi:hypothetical protein
MYLLDFLPDELINVIFIYLGTNIAINDNRINKLYEQFINILSEGSYDPNELLIHSRNSQELIEYKKDILESVNDSIDYALTDIDFVINFNNKIYISTHDYYHIDYMKGKRDFINQIKDDIMENINNIEVKYLHTTITIDPSKSQYVFLYKNKNNYVSITIVIDGRDTYGNFMSIKTAKTWKDLYTNNIKYTTLQDLLYDFNQYNNTVQPYLLASYLYIDWF